MKYFNNNKQLNDLLISYWGNGKKITIEGISGYGDRFVTTGRIAANDNGNASIYEECVMLELGKADRGKHYSDFVAPFMTKRPKDVRLIDPSFYILKIKDENGQEIYSNKKADKIVKETEKFGEETRKEYAKSNRTIEENDDVTKALKHMIGKAIIIKDEREFKGVLNSVQELNYYGQPIVDILSSVLIGSSSYGPEAKLYTLDENGDKILIADNNVNYKKNRDIFLRNYEKVNNNIERE